MVPLPPPTPVKTCADVTVPVPVPLPTAVDVWSEYALTAPRLGAVVTMASPSMNDWLKLNAPPPIVTGKQEPLHQHMF